jgi:hypothetical protein
MEITKIQNEFSALVGMKPKRINCYTCNVKRNKCKKLPKNVSEWLYFVCKDWKLRDLGMVVLDNGVSNA